MERGGRRRGSDDLVPVACRNSCLTTKKGRAELVTPAFLAILGQQQEALSKRARLAASPCRPRYCDSQKSCLSGLYHLCHAACCATTAVSDESDTTVKSEGACYRQHSTRYHLTATILCCHPRLSSVEGSALNRRSESRRPPDRRCRQVRTQSQFEWAADSATWLDGDWTACACGSVGCTVCNPCRGGSESGCGRCKG
jgi:hypothetical protein